MMYTNNRCAAQPEGDNKRLSHSEAIDHMNSEPTHHILFYCRQRLTEAVRQKSRYNQLSLYQIRMIKYTSVPELRFPSSVARLRAY